MLSPSFKVDYNQNLWYDFALDERGSLIDLVMKLHNCSLIQAIELFNGKQNILPKLSIANSKTNSPSQSRIEVIGSTNLCHPNLIEYFTHRGINLNIAKKYCREIHYRIGDRSFYAIGFPNNSYGYALRNPYFKGCLPPSNVSYVPSPSEQIIRKLCGMANNLNQLAHRANAEGFRVIAPFHKTIIGKIDEILNLIRK